MTDQDPSLVFIDWTAQTFVALDNVVGARNDVTLYGGPSWGFTYVNADVPEPATAITAGLALFGLALLIRASMVSHRTRLTRTTGV
jgi:hypothetical protein